MGIILGLFWVYIRVILGWVPVAVAVVLIVGCRADASSKKYCARDLYSARPILIEHNQVLGKLYFLTSCGEFVEIVKG